jgi:capsular exopolysaccharide synthesis family protein
MAQFLKLSITSKSSEDAPVAEASGAKAQNLVEIVPEQVDVTPESRIVFHTAPHTPGADRIRYLRMHLRNMAQAKGLKTVLITSPIAGDGKSTLALNLATALTEEGKFRVLLIEADLHHAPLAHRLGLASRSGGLVDCLERSASPLSVVRRLEPLGWYLLPAGDVRANPAELLQTTAYESVVSSLKNTFDWILVDSPPVVAVSDALFLRHHSDATLLVVRAGHTPQTAVDESIRQLGRQNIAAIVLNAVEGLDRMYYKYGNKYYGAGKAPKTGSTESS